MAKWLAPFSQLNDESRAFPKTPSEARRSVLSVLLNLGTSNSVLAVVGAFGEPVKGA